VSLVGVLTFAVPVASAEAAGGLLGPVGEAIIITMGAAGGGSGVLAAAPELAAAAVPVCATGVGCAVLAVGAVAAIGLYATRDTWVPWLKNSFGGGEALPPNVSAGAYGHFEFPDLMTSSQTFTVRLVDSGAMGAGNFYPYVTVNCKNAAGEDFALTTQGMGAVFVGSGATVDRTVTGCAGWDVSGNAWALAHGPWYTNYARVADDYLGSTTWGAPTGPSPESVYSQARVSCIRPDGTMYEVIGAEQLANGDVRMPSCVGEAGLAAGGVTGSVGRCVTLAGSTSGPTGPWLDQSSNCAAADVAAAAYPNCVGNSFCTYVIHVNGLPCSVGGIGCVDWPARAELVPQNYQCFFGPYQIGLDKCALLERAYEVLPTGTTIPASGENTDGDPRTHTGPTPSTPPPTTARVPAPTTTTTVEPVPCPVGAACTPPPPVPLGDDCFPSGWGAFNPVSWVQQPIQCAMKWTFVPSAAALTEVQTTATNDFTSQGFGPVLTALSADVAKVGGGSGCDGPEVTFSAVGIVKPMHPFSACAEPIATLASISYAVTTVVVILGGGWALLVAIGAGFGFNVKRGGGVET
jgi:hypothetical protein